MKPLLVVLLLFVSLAAAQNNGSTASAQNSSTPANGQLTVRGCVSRASGDYILIKDNPAITYELQATGKMKLRKYVGHYVEVTGQESPSMSTSSDTMARMGSASPVTFTASSIRTIEKECPEH